jgi:hypothetical protein
MPINKKICKHCQKPKTACKCGRPLFDGKEEKEVLSKLEYAHSLYLNDREASAYAGISAASYYRLIEKRPEIRERKQQVRILTNIKFREIVFEHAKKDPALAFKLLERLQPNQFGLATRREPPKEATEPKFKPMSQRTVELLRKYNPDADKINANVKKEWEDYNNADDED